MELKITIELAANFETVLRHCALDGAERVTYSFKVTEDGSNASLKYYDADNQPIGDDRDYDILKSCFGRLDALRLNLVRTADNTLAERLIEDQTPTTNIELSELNIDLDLISGQMSVSGK